VNPHHGRRAGRGHGPVHLRMERVGWGSPQVDPTTASSDTFGYLTPSAAQDFEIGLTVTDSYGSQASNHLYVVSNGQGCGAPFARRGPRRP
jgi:hypothetical protein